VFLSGELAVPEARPVLCQLACSGPARVRAAALRAAHAIEPWSREELGDFLDGANPPPFLLAAIALTQRHPNPPFAKMFGLLDHPDEEVRCAVLRAMPSTLPSEAAADLIERARGAEGSAARSVLLAFERTTLTTAMEDYLVELLDHPAAARRGAALAALSTAARPLRRPMAVWQLMDTVDHDAVEQARVFYCLERTGSQVAPALVHDTLWTLQALPLYFSARYLVATGDRRGVRTLLELVEGETDVDGLDAATAEEVLAEARRVLGSLAQTGPDAGPEAWRAWFERCVPLSREPLPRTGVTVVDEGE
jgi:hypothetical protein